MCLIGIAWKAHPDFPLIVAANRDEFHARATAPSGWWEAAPQLLAGRDLQSGGTWMGVTRGGRFAALTNFRGAGQVDPGAPSRGELVSAFLDAADLPAHYLAALDTDAARFNGFNLLAGTPEQLWYYGNRGGALRQLPTGIYGLSNALLDTPWPKVNALKSAMGAALRQIKPQEPPPSTVSSLVQRLFDALVDTRPGPDAALPQTGLARDRERLLSSAMIVSPDYGTRASTALCVSRNGDVFWEERSLAPDGAVSRIVRESFRLA